jgi:hypothetical protein
MLYAFVDPSAKNAPDTVLSKSCVFVTAVNGTVDGVKVVVYSAVPFTILRFEIYPLKGFPPRPEPFVAIDGLAVGFK